MRIAPHSMTSAAAPVSYAVPITPIKWWLEMFAATIDPPIIHHGSLSPARK
jgi:hypothetical protein